MEHTKIYRALKGVRGKKSVNLEALEGALDRLRLFASKVEGGRGEGEHFMAQYFLPRRTAFSTLLAELNELEVQAKVTPKDSANVIERVEGSDTLAMMQMTLTFEGGYAELIRFVNMVDKSKRFLIMESLNATPQQGGAKLNVMLKLDTFVVEDGSEL
jgi:Tfp pilus assembly protein PilO